MGEFFPAQVFKQLSHARAVIERHLAATLDTIHLFGSAIDGGLKPDSDIDGTVAKLAMRQPFV
ncbi:TPA: hypothetical protein RPC13_005313, partial [Escherichia coli]|nr:hypothetical protein [Escherichia coli]HEN1361493.1 hypothetical protein [Klebsiella pneumoniae]EIE3047987.1 hypothetical protein [Escherichia coli]HCP0668622.1 hypothetical protein [Escherichia coli]HDS7899833.1 hypothetical protein [Escherichia coli]